jgi:carbamoyltransferase
MNTELDFLIVGRCLLDKREQDMSLKEDYQDQFELD